jgi:integrase
MTNPNKNYKDRTIFSDIDVTKMLEKTDLITDEYRRLRAKALIALFKKFGKRRSEIARLQIKNDLIINNNFLFITWTISKKHKRGLFQYIKWVKKEIIKGKLPTNYLDKTQYSELVLAHKEWTKTIDGYKIKEVKRTKNLATDDKYCKLIIEYLDYMKKNYPEAKFLFPSCAYSFGNLTTMSIDKHLSGSQILRIIKMLDLKAWCHLFRETKGAEIARQYGNSLVGISQVRDTLDLEEENTAMIYTRRYAVQTITAEV